MTDEKLMALYRGAIFEVDADGWRVPIVVDALNPDLDAVLERRHARGGWAFITAWNPGHERPPVAENERAQALLEAHCRSAGLEVWRGDGASPDRTHVEASVLVAPIEPASAVAIGRAFRQHAIVVGATGEPATLLDLTRSEELPGGLPIAHASGQSLIVESMHLIDPFAGWIEGGPNGRRLREVLSQLAIRACGLPVHVRLPAHLSDTTTASDVARGMPRILCVARVGQGGDGLQPDTRWTAAWLVPHPIGTSSLEELLTAGLADVPLFPDLLEGESRLVTPVEGRSRPHFGNVVLRSADGVEVNLDSLQINFGRMTTAMLAPTGRHVGDVPIVRLALKPDAGAGDTNGLAIPVGSVAMRLSLEAGPIHHTTDDSDAWWRSRLVVVAVVEPGAQPLQDVLQTVAGALTWCTQAIDRDETP